MKPMAIAALWLSMTFVLFVPLRAHGDEAVNLIENPGFETGSGKEPPGWMPNTDSNVQSCELGVTHSEAHSGKAAFRIARVWGVKRPRAGVASSATIPIDPERKYLLSLWYKTSGIREYALPFMIRVMVNRKDYEPLMHRRVKMSRVPDWRQVYILVDGLPRDAVDAQVIVEMYIRTKGELFIDDVVFKEAGESDVEFFEQWRRQDLPAPKGNAKNVQLQGTGFFTMANAGGRWWLMDPEGQPTWSIATMGRYPPIERSINPLVQVVQEKYPDPMDYCRLQYGWFEQWGFNSFAGWTSQEMADLTAERYDAGKPYFPMYWVLSLSRDIEPDYCARDRNGKLKSGSHAFPDPFNPGWRQHAAQKAAETIAMFRDKPWFAGYFVDNEANFLDLFLYVWADYSGREFVADLEKKYGTIERLNKAWSSGHGAHPFNSFAEILEVKPEPANWDDPLFADFVAFERKMVAEYINYTYDLVKKLDPDHLVISNRINLTPMQDIHRTIDLWGKYDLVAMNMYQQNLRIGYSEGEFAVMEDLHRGTGKPVIIGEWGVPAIDSGLYDLYKDPHDRPLDWSWPQVVRTQKERAEVYNACMRQLASLDFIVGASWYRPMDADSPTRRANRGMFNNRHEPYEELVKTLRETNTYLKKTMMLP